MFDSRRFNGLNESPVSMRKSTLSNQLGKKIDLGTSIRNFLLLALILLCFYWRFV